MSRIDPVTPDKAEGKVKEIYDKLQKKTGTVYNIYQLMGNSAAVLDSYLHLGEMAKKTSLDVILREKIALLVSQEQLCHYCLGAHVQAAKKLGIEEDEIQNARKGCSNDPKTDAILKFAKQVLISEGSISDTNLMVLQNANVNDQEIAEIVLIISQSLFSSYFNLVAGTPLDFPEAPELH